MTKTPPADFFTQDLAKAYDERNSQLSVISDNMHFLIRLILQDLPPNSRILCVGVGTGAEILSLSKLFPHFTFVGVDPSAAMLDVCRERLKQAGVLERCHLINGYVHDVPINQTFDAALSILVAHFIKREDRLVFLKELYRRIKKQGLLLNTEISYDLNSEDFPIMLKNWEKVQTLMGATPESLAHLPTQLRDTLTVLNPEDTVSLLKEAGFQNPVCFLRAFMIAGWHSQKN